MENELSPELEELQVLLQCYNSIAIITILIINLDYKSFDFCALTKFMACMFAVHCVTFVYFYFCCFYLFTIFPCTLVSKGHPK